MINKINNVAIYLVLILPLTLITGPAVPDLTITFGGAFAIFWLFCNFLVSGLGYSLSLNVNLQA